MAAQSSNKTLATKASVKDFLAGITDERQRKDAQELSRLMHDITGKPAVMWGPSIIGFDRYHYKYESGREGDMCAIGFSPRKSAITIYLVHGTSNYGELLRKLGPYTMGKACLYIKRLSDVDMDVLEELIRASYNDVLSHAKDMHRTKE